MQRALKALPGVHVAGEMLDWEAPTGGYLLTAAMASGAVAAGQLLAAITDRSPEDASSSTFSTDALSSK